MRLFVLSILMTIAVVAGVVMGAPEAFANCNPWVRTCLSFRTMMSPPFTDGVRASRQDCDYLGCGW